MLRAYRLKHLPGASDNIEHLAMALFLERDSREAMQQATTEGIAKAFER